jgi:hypothetical protein
MKWSHDYKRDVSHPNETIKFWCDLNIITRIECILLKFHWGMKALIELHFQHEALPCLIENVLRSTLSYPNETSKEYIQFLNVSGLTCLSVRLLLI